MSEESPKLLELAKREFASANFSRAEEELFRAAQTGQQASARSGDKMQDDPANAGSWIADRVVRAECIAWLCTDREASALVTHRGIQIIGMRIDGQLDLSYAEINFPFRILNSAFTGSIFLVDTQLSFPSLEGCQIKELYADRLKIPGSLLLRDGFKAEGEVRLVGATIGGNLECDGAQFLNSKGRAFNANGVEIKGDAFFNGFKAEGEVTLVGATIGGNLECDGAQFLNSNGDAFSADGVGIKGDAFLRNGFKAEGEVRLLGATIGGSLNCNGAQFLNSKGDALSADGAEIKGDALLRNGFKAEGGVRLVGAIIGGNLECDGAQFLNSKGGAFNADAAEIKGSAFLRNRFKAEGEVRLVGATIGSLQIREVLGPENIVLDLRSANVRTFRDDEQSWPAKDRLFLDGFRYERLDAESPLDAKSRKKWLRRQPSKKFLPQPYEQLAATLREMGHEPEARLVMIAKNRERARFSHFPRQGWWWYNLFGRIISYGYAPWRAFVMSVAMIVIGAFLFSYGFSHDLISPTKESAYEKNSSGQVVIVNKKPKRADDYPVFNPFVYSLESFTPLLKLDQSANWAPNANHVAQWRVGRWEMTVTGGELRWYLWFHIIAGWVLTTLWVGAVTGLVKS
jgi:hypothetical protein